MFEKGLWHRRGSNAAYWGSFGKPFDSPEMMGCKEKDTIEGIITFPLVDLLFTFLCRKEVMYQWRSQKNLGGVSENNNTLHKTRQNSLIEISDLELEGNDDSWVNFLKYVCIFSFFT